MHTANVYAVSVGGTIAYADRFQGEVCRLTRLAWDGVLRPLSG